MVVGAGRFWAGTWQGRQPVKQLAMHSEMQGKVWMFWKDSSHCIRIEQANAVGPLQDETPPVNTRLALTGEGSQDRSTRCSLMLLQRSRMHKRRTIANVLDSWNTHSASRLVDCSAEQTTTRCEVWRHVLTSLACLDRILRILHHCQ
jgi:hypothetical protein